MDEPSGSIQGDALASVPIVPEAVEASSSVSFMQQGATTASELVPALGCDEACGEGAAWPGTEEAWYCMVPHEWAPGVQPAWCSPWLCSNDADGVNYMGTTWPEGYCGEGALAGEGMGALAEGGDAASAERGCDWDRGGGGSGCGQGQSSEEEAYARSDYQRELSGTSCVKWTGRSVGLSHIQVPRRVNLEELSKVQKESEEPTTLMVRNVPNRYDRGVLMLELDELGFEGKYDFVYLPIDNSTQWNVGYSFVNFDESKDAKYCMALLEGHQFFRYRHNNKRMAQVSWAHIQGLEKNLAHCSGTSLFSLKPWLRPWVRKWARKDEKHRPGAGDGEQEWLWGGAGEGGDAFGTSGREAVELPASSCTGDALWAATVRRLLQSSGTGCLRLLPDGLQRGRSRARVRLSVDVLRALASLAEFVDLANLEIEVASHPGEAPLVTVPGHLKDLDERGELERWLEEGAWTDSAGPRAGRKHGAKAARRHGDTTTWACSGGADGTENEQAVTDASKCGWDMMVPWSPEDMENWQSYEMSQQQANVSECYGAMGWPLLLDGAAGPDGGMGSMPWAPEVPVLSDCDLRLCYMTPEMAAVALGAAAVDSMAGPRVKASLPAGTSDLPVETCSAGSGDSTIAVSDGDDAPTAASTPENRETKLSSSSSDGSEDTGDRSSKGCATETPVTTLMVQHVPSNYSQEVFLQELELLGLRKACNFVYLPQLPMDPHSTWNVGCAFVNFNTVEDAERAREALTGHRWQVDPRAGGLAAEVSDAVVQGYAANAQHYSLIVPPCSQTSWEASMGHYHPQQSACLPNFAGMTVCDLGMNPMARSRGPQVPAAVSRTPSPSPERGFRSWNGAVTHPQSPPLLGTQCFAELQPSSSRSSSDGSTGGTDVAAESTSHSELPSSRSAADEHSSGVGTEGAFASSRPKGQRAAVSRTRSQSPPLIPSTTPLGLTWPMLGKNSTSPQAASSSSSPAAAAGAEGGKRAASRLSRRCGRTAV